MTKKLISLNFPIKKDLINKLSNIKLIKKTNWNFFTLLAGAKPPRRQNTETEASSRIAKKDCNHNTFFLMRRISAPRSASWGSGSATELATVFFKHQTLSVLYCTCSHRPSLHPAPSQHPWRPWRMIRYCETELRNCHHCWGSEKLLFWSGSD